MGNFLSFIYREIVYNGHIQALAAAGVVVFSSVLFSITVSFISVFIIYLSFYLIYIHDRYRGLQNDTLTNSIRSQHLRVFYRYIPYIIASLTFLILVLLYFVGNISATIFIVLITFFGFLYPVYFKGLTKKIIIFKNIYVSLVFSLLVIFPTIYYSVEFTQEIIFLIIIAVLFILSRSFLMQFFLDIKDIENDKKEGLLTLGVLWGREKILRFLNILNIVTVMLFTILLYFYIGIMSIPLLLLIPFTFWVLHLVKKGNFIGFILGSGEFILVAILISLKEIIDIITLCC